MKVRPLLPSAAWFATGGRCGSLGCHGLLVGSVALVALWVGGAQSASPKLATLPSAQALAPWGPPSSRLVGTGSDWEWPYSVTVGGDGRLFLALGNGGVGIFTKDHHWLGRCESQGLMEHVVVDGAILYGAGRAAGVEVFDISDVRHPRRIGAALEGRYSTDLALSGRYLYVVDFDRGLTVLDVKDPAKPEEVGAYQPGHGADWRGANGLKLVGRYLYLAGSKTLLEVLDISDPTQPRRVGGTGNGIQGGDVDLEGSLACVSAGSEGLVMVDVSDPSSPRQLGRAPATYAFNCVAIRKGYVYAGDGYGQVHTYDVKNPAVPRWVSRWSPPREPYAAMNFTLAGDRLFTALLLTGVFDLSLANPAEPVEDRLWLGKSSTLSVASSDRFSFSLQSLRMDLMPQPYVPGLWVMDGRGGGPLTVVGGLSGAPIGNAVALAASSVRRHAFLAVAGHPVLRVVDPIAAGGPAVVGEWDTEGFGTDLDVYGTLLGVAADQRVHFLDVSDPVQPKAVGVHHAAGQVERVTLSGNRVCLLSKVGEGRAVELVDITHPASPVSVANWPFTGAESPMAAVSLGNVVVLAVHALGAVENSFELRFLEVRSGGEPGVLGRIPLPGAIRDLRVEGGIVYAGLEDAGLVVVDASDPRRPSPLFQRASFGGGERLTANRVAIGGDGVLLAAGDPGVVSVRTVPAARQLLRIDEGELSKPFVLEVSPVLGPQANWVPLSEPNPAVLPWTVVDDHRAGPSGGIRFYRLRQP